jgi:NAD(P) transhydrogenase
MWKANLFLFLNLFQHTLSFLVTPYPALQNHVLPSQRNGLFPSLYMSIQSGLQSFDVAVIGGGPVGVKAALLAASSYNQSVVLIDAPRASGALMNEETQQDLSIGGPTGLFSKALRDVSKRIRVDSLRGMGLREDSIWNEIISSCIDLATLNSDDVYRQLKDAGVTYIQGLASFPDTGGTQFLLVQKLDNTLETLRVGNVLISTGSQPFRPGGIPFDGKRIFDSDSINQLSYLPSSIAITGSGIIAIEYAKIFR